MGTLLEDFDKKKYERTIRAEGYESGRCDGYESGVECGVNQEKRKFVTYLMSEHKSDDDICRIADCTKEELELLKKWSDE